MKPKHTDIPHIVYDNLRAVAESRVRRKLDPEVVIGLEMPHLSNADIFFHMPDKSELDWTEAAQPSIIDVTLTRIIHELRNRLDV